MCIDPSRALNFELWSFSHIHSQSEWTVSVPRIMSHEMMNEEIVTKVKGKIYIEVDISGFPQPTVAWLHGDTPLTKSSTVNIGIDTDWSCLKIRDVTAKDAGKYYVTAENKAGMDKAEFTVVVKCESL